MDGQTHLAAAVEEFEALAKRLHGLVVITNETVSQTIGGGGLAQVSDRGPASPGPALRGSIGGRLVNAVAEIRAASDMIEGEITRLRDSVGLSPGPNQARGPDDGRILRAVAR